MGEERDGGRTRSGVLYAVGTLAAEAADYKYVSGISFGVQTCCTFYNNINAKKPNPLLSIKKGKNRLFQGVFRLKKARHFSPDVS